MKKSKSFKKGSRPHKGGDRYDSRLSRDLIPANLPPLQDQLAMAFTYRFTTTGNFAGAFSVTPTNLLDAWFIAGTATNAYQLFDFVKVKRVTIRAMGGYSASTQLPPSATVGVEYMGLSSGSFAGGKQKSDTSLGGTQPAFVSLVPDPKSQVAQYQPASGSSIFTVRAVDYAGSPIIGAVIDVDVVLRNSGDVNPAVIAVARAGMTSGNLYFGGLDGNPLATTQARSTFIPRA